MRTNPVVSGTGTDHAVPLSEYVTKIRWPFAKSFHEMYIRP